MAGKKRVTLSDLEEEIVKEGFVRNTKYFILFSGLSLVSLSFQLQLSAGRLLGTEKITSYLIISKVQSKLKSAPLS